MCNVRAFASDECCGTVFSAITYTDNQVGGVMSQDGKKPTYMTDTYVDIATKQNVVIVFKPPNSYSVYFAECLPPWVHVTDW